MTEWLQKIVKEVDEEFEKLPEWKKTEEQNGSKSCLGDKKAVSTIKEPRSE